ncbi:DNA-binding protein [Aquamicrobium lusatiense]|uniref:helix-turn-helix transcriptional regulator n=1 Tax=Aquamicrobium lusatiense TaxID=89772 RepID=UPI002453AA6B|nr:DNA-binding protein [Aquamicrobium lusatiense]MDH4993319.1 DNA-binding protein [Aquamicrobium lusatiense]
MEASNDNNLAGDLLWGAAAIADYLGLQRRAIYHMAAKGTLPHFRAGDIVAARKSELSAWATGTRAAA